MTMQGRGDRLKYTACVAAMILAGGPLLSACDALTALDDTPDAQRGGVCASHVTGQRVDDSQCGDWDSDGFYDGGPTGNYMTWYPVNYGGDVPAVGQRVTGGTTRVPTGTPVAKGIPVAGSSAKAGGMAAIQRGGFGVKSGTSGGTGAKSAAGAVGGKSGGS